MGLLRRIRRRIYYTPDNLVHSLLHFHDVMSQTPMAGKYWVCGGMLLGYAREGQLIKNDFDFDFHYWRDDTEALEETLEILLQSGFKKCFRWVNNEGHTTEYVLTYREIKFEFFEATRQDDRIRWYCYYHRPPRQFFNETPAYELEPFKFYDRDWLKPDDHEQYLESVYGDWKTPCSDYTYYIDSKAIIQRDCWTGGNQW
jgi:phosphorylcholine metabolism protein LicD